MQGSKEIRDAVKQRAHETGRKRAEVLRRFRDRDWVGVAPPEQTFNRLRYQGHEQEAHWFLENLADLEGATLVDAEQKRRSVPKRGADVPAAAPADVEVAAPDETYVRRLILEAVVGTDETQPVRFLHDGSSMARGIGRIVTLPGKDANGTGFLVSPRLLLTNHHVLPSELDAESNLLQFNVFQRRDGSQAAPLEFGFQPGVLFLTSPVEELDYTLVAVEEINAAGARLADMSWSPLIGQVGKARQGDRVNIVHHPAGRPQQVSLRKNFLALMLPDYLHYMTDTMGGSSGSPVYNDDWEVVALHHAGVPIVDDEEMELYRTVMGTTASRDGRLIVNEGIRVSRIVAKVREQSAELDELGRGLVAQMLSTGPAPKPHDVISRPPDPYRGQGAAGWEIPITVRVDVVGGVFSGRPAATGAVPSTSREAARELELYKKSLTDQKSLIRGLTFLEAARERDYLPSATVLQQRQDDYYGNLPAQVANNQINPADLYDALNTIEVDSLAIVDAFPESLAGLESLARSRPGAGRMLESETQYARARAHLYTWCDLQASRMLQCIYTDTIIAPEQLLLKDALVEFELDDDLPPNFNNNRILNCEHIVPQSWFGATGVAVSDMHHLISARGSANLFRLDCAFRALGQQGTVGPANRPSFVPAAGRRIFSSRQFEPARNRGVVARATLYFLVAHKQLIEAAKYPDAALATLREWSNQNPPSDYERHRNDAIFEVQGNRNPLIDFPQWVDEIDFSRGLA